MIDSMIDDDASEIPMAVLDGIMQHGIPVKAAREAAGLSVEALAAQIRVSAYRIEAFETGEATPTPKEAEAISKATGVPSDIFIA
jgi:ribosome-binding protein aMBF1 (putative translation factor)